MDNSGRLVAQVLTELREVSAARYDTEINAALTRQSRYDQGVNDFRRKAGKKDKNDDK
jgi:hypothetical protein